MPARFFAILLTIVLQPNVLQWVAMIYKNSQSIFIDFAGSLGIPLIAMIIFLKLKGIQNWYVIDRKDRVIPFIINLFCLGSLYAYHIDPQILSILSLMILLSSISFVITLFWKISLHLIGYTAFIFLINPPIIYSPLYVCVGILLAWSRYYLKSHDVWQLAGGTLLSGIISWYFL